MKHTFFTLFENMFVGNEKKRWTPWLTSVHKITQKACKSRNFFYMGLPLRFYFAFLRLLQVMPMPPNSLAIIRSPNLWQHQSNLNFSIPIEQNHGWHWFRRMNSKRNQIPRNVKNGKNLKIFNRQFFISFWNTVV